MLVIFLHVFYSKWLLIFTFALMPLNGAGQIFFLTLFITQTCTPIVSSLYIPEAIALQLLYGVHYCIMRKNNHMFLQLRNALQKCSVLIIPMGTRSSAITQRNASLLLKPLKPPHMNRPSELNTLLICENMYGDLCRIVWAVSVGELNVMLVSCCNSMWIATYQQ